MRDKNGNLVSFEQVYDRYFQNIFQYILHRVAHVADAEDLTAQTFFKALRSLWKFRWMGVPISAWLYRIATNEVNAYLRKSGRHVDSGDLDDKRASEADMPDRELEEAEREMARHGVFLELNQCLRQMKPLDQTVITLRFLEEKSFNEIAEITGKRVGTVTMRTHRALEKLRTLLESRGIDHERLSGSFEKNTQTRFAGRPIQAELTP
ncbi:RNA polymerase sigma factor [Sulfidibacter corallicola]